jgi:hypothetical protein
MLDLLIRGAALVLELILFKLALKSVPALAKCTQQWLSSRDNSEGGV